MTWLSLKQLQSSLNALRQERTNELKCQGRIHLYAASTHVRTHKIAENVELTLNEKEKNAKKEEVNKG